MGAAMDEMKAEVLEAYSGYLAAFNAGDLKRIDAVIQYPLTYIGAGSIQTFDSFPFDPAEFRRTKQWHTTIDSLYEVVALSPTKAHVVLKSASRIRGDGSLIETVSAFYAFTRTAEGWKIFAVSDIVTPAP